MGGLGVMNPTEMLFVFWHLVKVLMLLLYKLLKRMMYLRFKPMSEYLIDVQDEALKVREKFDDVLNLFDQPYQWAIQRTKDVKMSSWLSFTNYQISL